MSKRAAIAELLHRDEPLLPELEPYLSTHKSGTFRVLSHPLMVQAPYHPALNAVYNEQYRSMSEDAEAKLARGDYVGWVWRHARPYRVDAFEKIAAKLSDEDYWTALAELLLDSENLWQWGTPRLRRLLEAPRPGRTDWMMDDEERATLAALPETVTVYRGYDRTNKLGWSWTTDRDKAAWFARRFATVRGSRPRIATATVPRANVLAYFRGRGESEVFVDPRDVKVTGVAPV